MKSKCNRGLFVCRLYVLLVSAWALCVLLHRIIINMHNAFKYRDCDI